MAHSHNGTAQLSCPACNYGPFTRNNYFTGKLLVERDFTDETHFHMEKLRHHEQLLHGWESSAVSKLNRIPTKTAAIALSASSPVRPWIAAAMTLSPPQKSASTSRDFRKSKR